MTAQVPCCNPGRSLATTAKFQRVRIVATAGGGLQLSPISQIGIAPAQYEHTLNAPTASIRHQFGADRGEGSVEVSDGYPVNLGTTCTAGIRVVLVGDVGQLSVLGS